MLSSLSNEAIQRQNLDDVIIQLEAIKIIINKFTQADNLNSDIEAFVKKLYHIHPKDSSISKPIIVEMLEIADSLHKNWYLTVYDEDINISGRPSPSIKDKTNNLMSEVLNLICSSFDYLSYRIISQDPQFKEKAEDQYVQTMSLLLEKILSKIENFRLDKSYVSVLVIDAIATILKVAVQYGILDGVNILMVLIRNVRNLVEWVYRKESIKFLNAKSCVSKVLSTILRKFVKIIAQGDFSQAIRKEMVQEFISMDTVDYILNNTRSQTILADEQASRVQEQIIRAYVSMNMWSLSPRFDQGSVDYLGLTMLKKIWRVIAIYSVHEKLDLNEFRYSYEIIDSTLNSAYNESLEVFSSEILFRIYSDCFFDFQQAIDIDTKCFTKINKAFHISCEKYQTQGGIISRQILDCLRANLKTLQNKTEDLLNLYDTNTSSFTTEALILETKIECFMNKLLMLFILIAQGSSKYLYIQELKQCLTEFLIKFSFSPVFYMSGSDNIARLLRLTHKYRKVNTEYRDLLTNQIVAYTTKTIELQELISQSSMHNTALTELFFQKVKPFLSLELSSKEKIKRLHEDDCFTCIRNTFALQSRLSPVLFWDLISIQSLTYETSNMQNITLVMSNVLHSFSTTMNFTLLSLNREVRESSEIKPEKISKYQISPFQDRFLCHYYEIPEVQEYISKKNRMLISRLIGNNITAGIDEEEAYMQKLSAVIPWQDFVKGMTSEYMLSLFDSTSDIQGFLNASCNFVAQLSRVILGQFSTESGTAFEMLKVDINPSSGIIRNYEDLERVARLGASTIERQFRLITKLLCYRVNSKLPSPDRSLLKRKQIMLLQGVRDVLPEVLLNLFDERLIRLYTQFSLTELMETIYTCFEGIFNRLVHITPNKNITEGLKKGSGDKGTLRREHRDLYVEYSYEKKAYYQFLSKIVVYYSQKFCHPVIDRAYRRVLCEFIKYVTDSLYEDSYPRDPSICIQLYQKSRSNKLRTLSSLLSFLTVFRSKAKDVNDSEHHLYIEAFLNIFKAIEICNRGLNLQEIYPKKSRVIELDFLPFYKDLNASLVVVAEESLIYSLKSDLGLNFFFKAFEALYIALKGWMDIFKVHKSINDIPGLKKNNLLILFYFGLMDANNFPATCSR